MKRMLALLVLGLSIVAGSAGSASATLIAHFEFEGNFLDSSGNDLDGVATGNPTFVADSVDRGWGAGLFGQALSLDDADGTADFVTVADNNLLDVTSLTLMAWVKVTRFGPEPFEMEFLAKPGSYELWPGNYPHTDVLASIVRTVPVHHRYVEGTTNIRGTGLWHHIAATYDEATGVQSIYVDGMLDVAASGPAGPMLASTHDFFIGAYYGHDQGTVALIDEVRIYDRALTLEEIQAVSKIPEPATLLLLGSGLLGLVGYAKKKKIA